MQVAICLYYQSWFVWRRRALTRRSHWPGGHQGAKRFAVHPGLPAEAFISSTVLPEPSESRLSFGKIFFRMRVLASSLERFSAHGGTHMVSCWPAADGALAIAVEIPPWEINAPLNGRRQDRSSPAVLRHAWSGRRFLVAFPSWGRQVCLFGITQTRQMSALGFLFVLLIDCNRWHLGHLFTMHS
jgi:hypothetical protein